MKFKKATPVLLITLFICSFALTSHAQCCTPDSLKVKSKTDSSFCVQWLLPAHCDSVRAFQFQYRPTTQTNWVTRTRLYHHDSLLVYCDTGTACGSYNWRVRNACLINGDTVFSAWINGPSFTLPCSSPKAAGTLHDLKISPNPARSSILITGLYSKAIRIEITNMNGKKVFTQNVVPQQGKVSLPVTISTFDKGIYFVTISDGSSAAKTNFIKE